jgi:hypothetical protein
MDPDDEAAIETESPDAAVVRSAVREAADVIGIFDGLYDPGHLKQLRADERP